MHPVWFWKGVAGVLSSQWKHNLLTFAGRLTLDFQLAVASRRLSFRQSWCTTASLPLNPVQMGNLLGSPECKTDLQTSTLYMNAQLASSWPLWCCALNRQSRGISYFLYVSECSCIPIWLAAPTEFHFLCAVVFRMYNGWTAIWFAMACWRMGNRVT